MPTYQYACTACGHQLEAVQSFADEPLTECPACEGRLRKLFSSVGVVFKGSGFYRTDSRTGTAKDGAVKDGAAKDGGTKDGAANDGGTKDGGAKDSGTSKDGAAGSTAKETPKKAATPTAA